MVTRANIESLKSEMADDRKSVNKHATEIRAVTDRLIDVEKKTSLIEYIATETKDLVADVNQRLAKIDVEIAKLAAIEDRERQRGRDRGRSPI